MTCFRAWKTHRSCELGVLGPVLRFFAFLFNLALSLCLFFVALLVMPSGQNNIQLSVIPLTGPVLTRFLLLASIYGFVAMVLALRKSPAARFPMLAWNIVIPALLASTPFRGQFSFESRDQALFGLYLFLASLAALWGSWLQFRARRGGSLRSR
jgi:hypothetical protein